MVNIVKELWKADRAAINVFLSIPSGFSTEVLAQAGWNSMTVDMQHGAQDYQSMISCFQAMLGHRVTPMVRVPSNEPSIIGRALDGGAQGVICPLVNSPADAERLVAACRYPPQGSRSNGAIRPLIYQPLAQYIAASADEILVIAMIESREALDNLEEILDVPGIDAIYVGPNDLGLSLGHGAIMEHEEPEILKIYDRLIRETSKRGIFAGIHCATPAYAERMIDVGFRLVTFTNDARLMLNGAKAVLSSVRRVSEPKPVAVDARSA